MTNSCTVNSRQATATKQTLVAYFVPQFAVCCYFIRRYRQNRVEAWRIPWKFMIISYWVVQKGIAFEALVYFYTTRHIPVRNVHNIYNCHMTNCELYFADWSKRCHVAFIIIERWTRHGRPCIIRSRDRASLQCRRVTWPCITAS